MVLIQNITNFRLQNREGNILNTDNNTPWIQIIKNSNQFNTNDTFPQIKLTSRILYNTNTNPASLHRIHGFPLLDIDVNGTRQSTTWSYYNSTVKPSLTRLDLSRNLVVLDFQSLDPVRETFKYLIIQLHSSSEELETVIDSQFTWYKYIFNGTIINPYENIIQFGPQLLIKGTEIASWFSFVGTTLDTFKDLIANIICEPQLLNTTNTPTALIDQTVCDLSLNNNVNTYGNSYDLNNLFWYSLRTPTHISSDKLAFDGKKRFFYNFNKKNGGGYKKNEQTIDIARKTRKPYGIINDISFAPQNNEGYVSNIDDINYYEIEFKPIINPINTISLTYQFGKNFNSKVTFFRESDMDGTPTPSGKDISSANRESESITLTWNANEQEKKTIKLLDIASGYDKISANFTTQDNIFNDISNNMENYDIITNVFQFNLIDTKQNSNYKVLNLFGQSETFDLSYVPINYRHFSYDEIFTDGGSDNPYREEINPTVTFNLHKVKKTDNTLFSNLLFPKNQINFPSVTPGILDVSRTDLKVNIRPNNSSLETDTRVILSATDINPFSDVNENCRTLNIENNFISDYWQYNDKLLDLSDNTIPLGDKELNFGDFIVQTKIAALVILVGVTFNKNKVLINTSGVDYVQNLPISSSLKSNIMATDNQTITRELPEFDLYGGTATRPVTQDVPALITTAPRDFPNSVYTNHNTKYPNNIFPNDDISISSTDGNFIYDIYDVFKNPVSNTSAIIGSKYYNGKYLIDFKTSNNNNNTEHNENFIDISVNPTTIEFNLVEMTPGDSNGPFLDEEGALTYHPFLLLANDNDQITLTWGGLNYDLIQGNIYWTISRFNTQDETTKTVTQIVNSTMGGTLTSVDGKRTISTTARCFRYEDRDIRIYDKYIYSVTGIFKWYPFNDSRFLSLHVPIGGSASNLKHTFKEMIVCKFNRFPYGRWNTTTTNFKLYRPLLINTDEGQVDQFGRRKANCTSSGLFSINRQISSSNNIFSNTADQTSKKLTYSRLAKTINRPYR